MFEVFCNVISTDAWQPITSWRPWYKYRRKKKITTPPSVTLTFVLASGKYIEGLFYLTNSSATCTKTGSAVSQLLFHSSFLYQTLFQNNVCFIIDSIKGVLPLGKFPRILTAQFHVPCNIRDQTLSLCIPGPMCWLLSAAVGLLAG